MLSLFTFTTEPGPCGYLPNRMWSLSYDVVGELTPLEYQEKLKAGWRRFGYSLFRPACPSCRMCQSIRVPVATFRPDRSQRRAMAANETVQLVVGSPEATREKLKLYDRFHDYQHVAKGWSAGEQGRSTYGPRGVYIVSACMHDARHFGREWKPGRFLDRQCVDVPADRHHWPFGVAATSARNDSRARHAPDVIESKRSQCRFETFGRALFLP